MLLPAFLLAMPLPAFGQEVVQVRECVDPCPRVTFDVIARIGTADDPALFSFMTDFALTPDSLLVAAPVMEPGRIAFYELSGEAIGLAGREGSGPGEFRLPWAFPGLGGPWITDRGNQRITPIGAGQELEPSFRFSFRGFYDLVPTSSGRAVVTGALPAEDFSRSALHVVDSTGAVLISRDPYAGHPLRNSTGTAIGANPGSDRFYSAFGSEYRILEWGSSGIPLRELHRKADWFEENVEPVLDPMARPAPRIADLYLSSPRRLWVLVVVPEERDYPPARKIEGEMPAPGPEVTRRRIDYLVEVIDLDSNRVVARGRYDASLEPLLHGNLFYSAIETEEGYVFFDLIRAGVEAN